MKLLFESVEKRPVTAIILDKSESDALAGVLCAYLKTKPNKRSAAYKLAEKLEGELLC